MICCVITTEHTRTPLRLFAHALSLPPALGTRLYALRPNPTLSHTLSTHGRLYCAPLSLSPLYTITFSLKIATRRLSNHYSLSISPNAHALQPPTRPEAATPTPTRIKENTHKPFALHCSYGLVTYYIIVLSLPFFIILIHSTGAACITPAAQRPTVQPDRHGLHTPQASPQG